MIKQTTYIYQKEGYNHLKIGKSHDGPKRSHHAFEDPTAPRFIYCGIVEGPEREWHERYHDERVFDDYRQCWTEHFINFSFEKWIYIQRSILPPGKLGMPNAMRTAKRTRIHRTVDLYRAILETLAWDCGLEDMYHIKAMDRRHLYRMVINRLSEKLYREDLQVVDEKSEWGSEEQRICLQAQHAIRDLHGMGYVIVPEKGNDHQLKKGEVLISKNGLHYLMSLLSSNKANILGWHIQTWRHLGIGQMQHRCPESEHGWYTKDGKLR